MPGSWPPHELPGLTDQNCHVTSPATTRYNCIAWAAESDTRWWWPDAMGIGYWPANIPRLETSAAFVAAYGTLGYTLCFDGSLETGIEKIALYAKGPAGIQEPTHAARQLQNGEWTSKMGTLEDASHDTPGDVEGPMYGSVLCYMSRRRR